MNFKLITPSLGPNNFSEDVFNSLKLLINPFLGRDSVEKLEREFGNKFNSQAISFNSGRSALLVLLKSMDLKSGDEVLVQAYTCVAVPDTVLWADLKPIFVDIDEENLGIDPEDLTNKITNKTKVIIVQHTFGIPSKIDQILAIAKKNNLKVIEDCAHCCGIFFKGKKLGEFADAAIFSFGRDKPISSIFGGMVITKNIDLANKIRNYQSKLKNSTPFLWIVQQLIYNPLAYLIVNTYGFLYLGKLLHLILNKLKILSKAIFEIEKNGKKPAIFPGKLNSKLGFLALSQFQRLDNFNQKRLSFSNLYSKGLTHLPIKLPPQNLSLLRYTILVDNPKDLQEFAKVKNIYLDSWYDNVVAPRDVDLKKVGYKIGSCPKAELICTKSINLPTNPNLSEDEILKVIATVKDFYAQS